MSEPVKITGLLKAWASGDLAAQQEFIPLVYRELHEIASRYRRKAGAGDSLQTTALVMKPICGWSAPQIREPASLLAADSRRMGFSITGESPLTPEHQITFLSFGLQPIAVHIGKSAYFI